MRPRSLVYGVGTNDALYKVNTNGNKCPFYSTWANMLKRCYCTKYHKVRPTYTNCVVCKEWLTFSNFKVWMEQQPWEGNQLDKDLLLENNTLYCPQHCLFITPRVNSFILDSKASRGEWPIGVSWNKTAKQFTSKCRNPFTGKYECLGYFKSPIVAHEMWKKRKGEIAILLAGTQTDQRVAEALLNRYVRPTIY